MSLLNKNIRKIVYNLLSNINYRKEVIPIIDEVFLKFAIDFFKKILSAKLNNMKINLDWYKKEFLNSELSKDAIAINSGLNLKTITNEHGTTRKEIVINAAEKHYDYLKNLIQNIVEHESSFSLILTIKLNRVSVDLTIEESLIVINALAVQRAKIRGGIWSSVGKRVEKPLMLTLCAIYEIPKENYFLKDTSILDISTRESDFFFKNNNRKYRCEIKLMGRGNPESGDAAFARDCDVLIADTMSIKLKNQLEKSNIEWIELKSLDKFKKIEEILQKFFIPHKKISTAKETRQVIDNALDKIFN